ncbi:pyrokinin-1 receptor-like isoform X1 [Varroa jacobsoni]|uniref:pyrokinin-1 receptor-like isoform X1 n=1 Tax=Varroa jacobsoni TaxID=62625 RepID=UPI000BF9A9DD|nr:pyrokinin-1 receptor-like isoform X1 [Varroa jacobsoni]XP_022695320.1 pyrokinin-1 receptor-like isoform X1 [Varroa jacobsoni]XP_022695324.1 pyrokinin-1 receptor-like isoform X1 [Varroa jacobsoni]XP_022695332.1 pyrokinin-1 receptor-like isoform X1 [Varroa jacobsoni]XP_022695341.1 pyrokinin-1 receptor-like isoform X1 [Varroa jacobsoni]XP_022695349.1 pyrokinin-1 receptor-like isoform X1 [Varroa jacobsoni]XP_022695359.1 pyrokinin-1 receptor-like isoform X1 [Varroa jacobsoni]
MFGDPSSEMGGGGVDGADLGSPAKGTSGNVTALGGLVAPKLGDDIDAYLFTVLGPRALPLAWLIPLTAIYTFIFITGIVGNVCTCMVIALNTYMQTATNCYLFNLAIADMLTLLCGYCLLYPEKTAMPMELYTFWHQYPWQLGNTMCDLRALVTEATAYASILTIVTFSLERYMAICHPMRQPTKSKITRAVWNIIVIWILSILAASPYTFFMQVNYLTYETGEPIRASAWCGFPFNQPDNSWEFLLLCSTFVFFVAPISIIMVLYLRIAVALNKTLKMQLQRSYGASGGFCVGRAGPVASDCSSRYHRHDGERSKMQSRRVVVRMLAAVVIAFFLCWAPYHSQRLLFLYVSLHGNWNETLRDANQKLYTLAGCFYYFNSTINPILYSIMSNRFRVAFREKLCPPRFGCCALFRQKGDDNIAGGRSGRSGGGNYRAPSASSQPSGAAPNSARLKHGVHGTTHPSKHTTPSVKWTSKDKAGQQEMNNADGRDNSRTLIYDSQHHIKVPVIRKFSLSGKSSAQFKYPANGDE